MRRLIRIYAVWHSLTSHINFFRFDSLLKKKRRSRRQILSEIWRQNSLILRVSYELAESMLNETWTLVGHFVLSPTERERKGTDEQVDEKKRNSGILGATDRQSRNSRSTYMPLPHLLHTCTASPYNNLQCTTIRFTRSVHISQRVWVLQNTRCHFLAWFWIQIIYLLTVKIAIFIR